MINLKEITQIFSSVPWMISFTSQLIPSYITLHPVCKYVMPISLSITNYTDQVNQCKSVHKENKRMDCTLYFRHKYNIDMYVANLKPDIITSAFM